MIASKTTSGNTISPERPAGRWTRVVSIFSKINLFLSFALLILLSGCGGGPDVTQATGHGILLATPQGLFNISFSSNGSSTLTSTTPIIAGGINAMVAVENASHPFNGPMLVTANDTTLSAYAMTGGTPSSTGQPITPSSGCAISSINSLAVTPDGKYLLASSRESGELYIITLASGYPCTQTTITSSSTNYPTSVAVECLQLNSCQIFLTLSSSTSSVSPTTPEVLSWTETQPPGSPTPLTDLTPPASSVIFDNETSYFYSLVTSSNSSVYNVSGVTPLTATSKYGPNVTYGNVPFSNPCLDPLGQTLYTPTSNGSVYSASVSTSGSIGSPQQIWSLSSNPSGVQISPINSCVAY